jgi:hypothetical protein
MEKPVVRGEGSLPYPRTFPGLCAFCKSFMNVWEGVFMLFPPLFAHFVQANFQVPIGGKIPAA